MKVDLMKPIRRKSTGEKVVIIPGGTYYYITDNKGYRLVFEEEVESYYENIPQKPKEFIVHLNQDGTGYVVSGVPCDIGCIRVIEWPKDAPLPDLPET